MRVPLSARPRNDYPTSDGKPMAETDFHRILMNELIVTLQRWYGDDPDVYVSDNLLLFYEQHNKRRHISPDVLVALGVEKGIRENYLLWEEGVGPAFVIELTSKTTTEEDTETKMNLYRDVLQVSEYFLFDPKEDYLSPSFQAFRLVQGEYVPIEPQDGRLTSEQLGLQFERDGWRLRIVDPTTGRRLPTTEVLLHDSDEQIQRATLLREESEAQARAESRRRQLAEQARRDAEELVQRLLRENEELRRRIASESPPT